MRDFSTRPPKADSLEMTILWLSLCHLDQLSVILTPSRNDNNMVFSLSHFDEVSVILTHSVISTKLSGCMGGARGEISHLNTMKKEHSYYVYIMASGTSVLYIGVTSNLLKRVYQHKNHIFQGFTDRYRCHKLVHIEQFSNIYDALSREKHMKRWNRMKKVDLINIDNPQWNDLAEEWY